VVWSAAKKAEELRLESSHSVPAEAGMPTVPGDAAAVPAHDVAIETGGHRVRLKWHRLKRHRDDLNFTPRRLREGMAAGAAVEVDLRLHADHSFVCLHDDTLDRETTGRGPVAAASADALRALRLRDEAGQPSDQPPILLEELAELARHGRGVGLVQLDLKETDAVLTGMVACNFRRTLASVAERFILSGNDWAAVCRLADKVPGMRRGFDPCSDDSLDHLHAAEDFRRFAADALARASDADMIYLDYRIVLAAEDAGVDLVAPFHDAGKAVDAWTLNTGHARAVEALHRLVALQVDQITTDEPGALHALFEQHTQV
jgi:glycerophosphoryl diester phosphodiesterase